MIDFWFSAPVRPGWFNATRELDQEIESRFAATWEIARDGELAHWSASPQGALALVIVLDQFPLNMFRGRPESFSTESASRRVADQAISAGFDRRLADEHKAFLYMPFMHSEALADQDRSVGLYQSAGLMNNLRFALHHREIVRRFGRFPHRNAILGRSSSPAELAWLDSPEAFRG